MGEESEKKIKDEAKGSAGGGEKKPGPEEVEALRRIAAQKGGAFEERLKSVEEKLKEHERKLNLLAGDTPQLSMPGEEGKDQPRAEGSGKKKIKPASGRGGSSGRAGKAGGGGRQESRGEGGAGKPESQSRKWGFNEAGPYFGPDSGAETGEKVEGEETERWGLFKQVAARVCAERNFPLNVCLAQAALESARGSSNISETKNNFFGYQAYDRDPYNSAKSYQGSTEEAMAKSVNDYIDLITKSGRYKTAWNNYQNTRDSKEFVYLIHKAGYATDPDYVKKVISMREFGIEAS